MRFDGPPQRRDYPDLSIFGGEARLFTALAFIPDPEEAIRVKDLAEIINRDPGPVLQASYQLAGSGLLLVSRVPRPQPKELTRIESPLWAIYESAKIVLKEIGIESPSIVSK